ncbi:MAG: riboflavin synthase [Phycisphaerae bacterium]|nr:riboflavin synthase [Phycisphaerae bacterium]
MFTGIIETVGRVSGVFPAKGGLRLVINVSGVLDDVKPGDSIAVNGVCLTAKTIKTDMVEFDVSAESVSKTTAGKLKAGVQVNVERAMRASDRFGGHFVQGHIDAVGKVKAIEKKGDFWGFVFAVDEAVKDYLVSKGSIAIDGVSLTIAEIDKNSFGVAIIPATFENTTFKNYKVGDAVNIETDVLCRIIRKQIGNILPGKSGMTIEKLKEMGF